MSNESLNNDLLKVSVDVYGRLVITIGLGCLKTAYELDPVRMGELTITDMDAVSEAVVGELLREEEDGSTPVHRMLDQAFYEAVEQGCEGVEFEGDE